MTLSPKFPKGKSCDTSQNFPRGQTKFLAWSERLIQKKVRGLLEDQCDRGESFRYFHKITFQVGEKEWEKYRVAFVIQGKPHYLEDDDKSINTKV